MDRLGQEVSIAQDADLLKKTQNLPQLRPNELLRAEGHIPVPKYSPHLLMAVVGRGLCL